MSPDFQLAIHFVSKRKSQRRLARLARRSHAELGSHLIFADEATGARFDAAASNYSQSSFNGLNHKKIILRAAGASIRRILSGLIDCSQILQVARLLSSTQIKRAVNCCSDLERFPKGGDILRALIKCGILSRRSCRDAFSQISQWESTILFFADRLIVLSLENVISI